MAPRKAAATGKAAAAVLKKATAVKATAAAAAAAEKTTATKRKRADVDDETAVPTTNGVNGINGVNGTVASQSKKVKTDTAADKENADPTGKPLVNGHGTKKAKAPAKKAAAITSKNKSASPPPAATAAATKLANGVDAGGKAKPAAAAAAATTAVARKTAAVKRPAAAKIGAQINTAPTQPLDVFVFGEGGAGELGLGSVRLDGKKPMDVKRPRLNPKLAAATVGVVQVATGGMHAVALTRDNKILTWGVNDQGALGRDTAWEGGLRDMGGKDGGSGSDSDSDDSDDSGLNPRESTPGEIDTEGVAAGTVFVQVVASDSASFALTSDGRVYGWGTFRASDGVLGFSPTVSIQRRPALLAEPRKIVQLATGSNHILALDARGKLYTWGCPEQNQLGRRCVQRDIRASALRPGGVAFRRGVHLTKIACGSYHSFALDQLGRVYAWGLNNFGQLNVARGAGDTDATVLEATLVSGLASRHIVDIDGGEHHSLACADDGALLTWGRIDGHQVGLPDSAFTPETAIFDDRNKPRILREPTVVPDIPPISSVSAGTDNNFALTPDGKAFSWGFSTNYQTGQGTTDDVETPMLIDNTAVRGRKLVYAGAGGQFSILASVAE